MSYKTSQVIQEQMEPGESLIWSGQPAQGIRFRGSDGFMIPFSLLWCWFAVYWEISAIRSGAPLIFSLWGIPFILVGLYFVFGRFVVESNQRAKTYYALTNERIIIVSGVLSKKVKSLNLRTLSDLSLSQGSGDIGSISFGPSSPFGSWFGGASWPGMDQFEGPKLDYVQDAKSVYQQIRKAQNNAT